jgi:sugar/nucleoside kinase (ribokinase family)
VSAGGEIVCVGRTYVDVVVAGLASLPRAGREEFARDAAVTPGGGAFITAAHLVALGRKARLASALGQDAMSVALEPAIRAVGLDLSLVERFAGGPQLTVALAVGDDRAFATKRCGPAAPAALRAWLETGDVRHVHVGELATLRELPWLRGATKARGMSLSLDVAWDDEVFADPAAFELACSVDLVMPNAAEAAALSDLPESKPYELLAAFAARDVEIALKLGARGAAYARAGRIVEAGAPRGPVIDATGAGDAFAAGFLDSWLDDRPPEICLARGIACGAHATRHLGGARVLPDRATIDELAASVPVPHAATAGS